MSPKKILVLTAVVAALFGFIFFVERKMPTTEDRQRKGDLYWDIPTDRIERIQLVRAGETLEFQRDATAWKMIRPEKYPADSFAVNGVASELGELKRAGGTDASEARPADYGLEKPVARATLVWADPGDTKSKKTRTIEFGIEIPGTDVVAARVEGTEKVLFVPSSVLAALKKHADEFESREVFGGSATDAARVEILRGRARLVLARKDGAWWLSEPVADLADAGAVDRLVGQLTALRAKDFVHEEDLATIGLNPPLFRVTLAGPKGAPTIVDFGATRSDGNSVYAKRESQVLTVERDIVDELSKEAVAFRSVALLGFPRGEVSGLEATVGKRTYALSQKDGGWMFEGRPVLAAAADDVIAALLDLKSKSFLDDAEIKDLGAPLAAVTVKVKSGSPWTLSIAARAADTVARVSGRPGGFAVERDAPQKLEDVLRRATAEPTPAATKKAKP